MGSNKLSKNWGQLKSPKTVTQITAGKSFVVDDPLKLTSIPNYIMPADMGNVPSSLLWKPAPIENPNQEYNRDSQYTRYEKALKIAPVKTTQEIDEQGLQTDTFFFASEESSTGYWEVQRLTRKVFISFLRSITLFGSANYQLAKGLDLDTNSQSQDLFPDDYDEWNWVQVEGIRTVIASDNSATPILYILGASGGTGIVSRSKPVVIRASLEGSPIDFDDLIIFTLPISSWRNLGLINEDKAPEFTLRWHFIPRYANKAFKWTDGQADITWSYPQGDWKELDINLSFVDNTSWLVNETGSYLEYARIPTGSLRKVTVSWDKHYKASIEYDPINGSIDQHERVISRKIFIPSPNANFSYLFGNDTWKTFTFPVDIYSKTQSFSEISITFRTAQVSSAYYAFDRGTTLIATEMGSFQEFFPAVRKVEIIDSLQREQNIRTSYLLKVRGLEDNRARGLADGRVRASLFSLVRGLEDGRTRSLENGESRIIIPNIIRGLEDGRSRGLADGRVRAIAKTEYSSGSIYRYWGQILAGKQDLIEYDTIGNIIG